MYLSLFVVARFDLPCQHACRLGACACWLLMVDLHITGRLLIGMGKKLKPAELCSHALAHKPSKEWMWCLLCTTAAAKPGESLLSS